MTNLLLISGLPCTGKTTLASKLADSLHWPWWSKDDVKELLFDSFGWGERATSENYSQVSNLLIIQFTDKLLRSGKSVIIESNFRRSNEINAIRLLKQHYGVKIIEIYCTAPDEIILQRFTDRVQNRSRHPGHVDDKYLIELRDVLESHQSGPLGIGEQLFVWDSIQGDYDNLLTMIQQVL